MLTAYERHLLADYLANAASGLHYRDQEAKALAEWVADRDNRIALAGQRRRRRTRRWVLDCGDITSEQFRNLRQALHEERAGGRRRRDRTGQRLQRLAKMTALSQTDVDILEFLLCYQTQPVFESMVDDICYSRSRWHELNIRGRALSLFLGLSPEAIAQHLRNDAPLIRTGLVCIEGDGDVKPVDPVVLATLRDAILTRRMAEFYYLSRATGRRSRQAAKPYGLLYGNRAFLVARTDWRQEPRLWRLANMEGVKLGLEDFERDPTFDLQAFARRSFGTFQEKPVKVELRFNPRAALDAAAFLFHSDQTVRDNPDGTVAVRFEAGGLDEMCWHLVTWGDSVTVEKPARLRQRLAAMCETLAAHHGEQTSRSR